MENNFIDMHMHSFYSDDGEFTPSELVKKCHKSGVRIMAIADHNTVKAIDEAIKEAQKYNIDYIPAIEIDCTYKGINLHVIGYGIDYKNDIFNKLEENIVIQEIQASEKKLELTNRLGFNIKKQQLDEVSKNGIYTGEMFAEVLLNDERYNDNSILEPYRAGGSRSDNPYVNFYWDYYSQGKPCYSEIVYPSLEETVKIIKNNGGIAVLAHPGNNLKGCFDIFDEMIDAGIEGVEAFSSYHDDTAIQYFLDKGINSNLLITCGSDYHGKTKPAIQIGKTGCFVDETEIEKHLKKIGLI
ncbi:PHP domain-containing protein [Clostridium butyricum]|uniref:PHP domain-containing protein n=1 Tax=Clostridium butyricum TaxID=1492 RepID=UPI0024BBBB8B|nr:PHP domain-containing protein [Clostridium butyricum]